ncbi:MAG: menaquinol-cytochrome C reductase [Dehalococcoidia bacterium]|nr:menaquinol-cytochrome C reductase [Dehalococcoidia bacterium]
MAKEETVVQDINPKDPNKTYGLMELMKGRAPLVDKGGPEESLFSWPHLMLWITVVFLGLLVVLVGISWIFDAPLREPFDVDVPENPAKAPWYFLNLQELLLHMDKSLAGVLVPTVVLGALMALPYIDRNTRDTGIWYGTKKGLQITLFTTVYTLGWITVGVLFDETNIYGGFLRLLPGLQHITVPTGVHLVAGDLALYKVSLATVVAGWLLPVVIMVGLTGLLVAIVEVRWRPNIRERAIALFTGFAVAYLYLIVISMFFRGLGMHLTWPWDLPPNAIPF